MDRHSLLIKIKDSFKSFPIVALLGPRQSGKTTLAHQYIQKYSLKNEVHFFDLEKPSDYSKLENPQFVLESLEGLVVIDEIQRGPHLFPLLRNLADYRKKKCRYLILGSASLELVQKSAESLAGRIRYLEVSPFSLKELQYEDKLWIRGGFPNSFLAKTEKGSVLWREQYIQTFLEKDISNLGINVSSQTMRRLWMMLTHYHGQILNLSELGKSLGVSDHTVRRYLDILCGTFMMRQLQPWYANISKRQVKAPKIYFRDSGIFHTLLDMENKKQLIHHPKLGASWEGFALESIIQVLGLNESETYFWSSHSFAEVDLYCLRKSKPIGFEVKFTLEPKITKSMRIAMESLELSHLYILHAGEENYLLDKNITAVSLQKLGDIFSGSQK
jgi:predicted AAA+ superfamily ATPase